MATEYKLSYTAADINERLGKIDALSDYENRILALEQGSTTTIKVMSFPQFDNSDIMTGYSVNEIIGFIYDSEDMTKNPLPENAVVVDIGIVLNDDTEIRKNQMWNVNAFCGAVIEICNTSVYDETYCYPVIRVINPTASTFNYPLFETIMSDGYKQLNVYYI